MNSLSDILNNRLEIEREFSRYFIWANPYPIFSSEVGSKSPHTFKGFWIMGDGPGATVTPDAGITNVDAELLLNVEISETQYCQFELQGNAVDPKVTRDYIGYFNNGGRAPIGIRRRLEALMYAELLAMHDYLVANHSHQPYVKLDEIFSEKEIKKVMRSGRKLIRAQSEPNYLSIFASILNDES